MADQKLLDLLNIELAKGTPEADIHASFGAKGWSPEDINGALAIAKIQRGSFSASKPSYNVISPRQPQQRVKHGAGLFVEIAIIAILLVSAPGAYGLVTQVFWPAAKGQPVAIEDTVKGYELLRDVPSLIPVGEGTIKTSGGTSTKAPVTTSGGSHTTTTTAPAAPAPAVSVQLSQSSPKAPSVSFSASNRTVTPGATVVLSWRADDATSCIGTGFDAGGKNKGSLRVAVPVSAKYTVTCSNAAGSTVQRLSVTAETPRTPTPDPTPNPTPETPNNPTPVAYTVTASAGSNGSISPSGAATVASAANKTYTITPASGYRIATMAIDGSSVTPASTYTFSNITGNHTISATFAVVTVDPPPAPVTYTLTASAGSHGAISPSGATTVTAAANKTYTIAPASGYQIASLTVDGSSVTPSATYAFSNITGNHTIAVTFSLIPVVTPPTNPDPIPTNPPSPSTATATDTPSFLLAIKNAKSGDTITLAPGTYSGLSRFKAANFTGNVTVTSENTRNQAIFTDLIVTDSSGLTFRDLEFSTAGKTAGNIFGCTRCTRVHFLRLNIHGSMDGNPVNDANGFAFIGSRDVSLKDSEFQQLGRALIENTNDGLMISGNTFHDLRSDGIDNAQTKNVTITNNTFRDFYRNPADHPDGIQFWTNGTTIPSENIIITNNTMQRGSGQGFQGIYMDDDVGNVPYINVTISGNHLTGTGYRGISIQRGRNVTISNNTLLSYPGSTNKNLIYISDSDMVTATNNQLILPLGLTNVTNLTESGNTINATIPDPFAFGPSNRLLASVLSAWDSIKGGIASLLGK